jgi:hypothetical protein
MTQQMQPILPSLTEAHANDSEKVLEPGISLILEYFQRYFWLKGTMGKLYIMPRMHRPAMAE